MLQGIPAIIVSKIGGKGYYRTLTLNQPGSDLSSFPLLFTGTFSWLADRAHGGNVVNSNAYDIVFYSDAALTTKLDFERVSWDSTSGLVEFHVRVPTLTSASAKVIYIAYGSTNIVTDQQNVTGVWDTNYQGVWHLKDGTTLSLANSVTGNSGTNNGADAVSGKIDGAVQFVSANGDYVTMSNILDFTNNDMTIEFWYFSGSGTSGYIINKAEVGGTGNGYIMYWNGSGRMTFYLQTNATNWKQIYYSVNTANSAWHHCMVTRSGTSNPTLTMYIDGSVITPVTQSAGTVTTITNTGDFKFSDTFSLYDGYLDEVRVSNSARSADWVSASWSNQNDPANFYIIGSETPV